MTQAVFDGDESNNDVDNEIWLFQWYHKWSGKSWSNFGKPWRKYGPYME